MSILPKFPKLLQSSDDQKAAEMERQLIHFESQFGRKIFGPIPANHHRDFFNLDEFTWIWHEDWVDEKGEFNVLSTRYVLRPDGAIKSQNGGPYQKVGEQESKHLYIAIKKYVSIAQEQYAQLLAA